jgi:hypothetical protein
MYTSAKSIFMDCNKPVASEFDVLTHTQVWVVDSKAREGTLPCQTVITSIQAVIAIIFIIENYI